jgi:hypothetical protein
MRTLLDRGLGALGCVAAGLGISTGCSMPVRVDGEASWDPFEAKVTVQVGGELTTTVTSSESSPTCMRIRYTGADGAVLQTVTVQVPGSAQVPAGAVRQEFDIVDCPPPPGLLPSGSGAPGTAGRWHDVYSCPITVGEIALGGPVCRARVWCGPNQDPLDLLRPVLIAGPGSPVPATIDIAFFAESEFASNGGILRVAVREPIMSLRLDWNGIAGFGDLRAGVNAYAHALPNGWYAVESLVGSSDTNDGLGEWNRGAVTFRTPTRQSQSYSLGFQNLAF